MTTKYFSRFKKKSFTPGLNILGFNKLFLNEGNFPNEPSPVKRKRNYFPCVQFLDILKRLFVPVGLRASMWKLLCWWKSGST